MCALSIRIKTLHITKQTLNTFNAYPHKGHFSEIIFHEAQPIYLNRPRCNDDKKKIGLFSRTRCCGFCRISPAQKLCGGPKCHLSHKLFIKMYGYTCPSSIRAAGSLHVSKPTRKQGASSSSTWFCFVHSSMNRSRVARWYMFARTENSNFLVNFGRPRIQWKSWYILWPFGTLLLPFDVFSMHFVSFFPLWYVTYTKNLATTSTTYFLVLTY
jgi:hypothetical protein